MRKIVTSSKGSQRIELSSSGAGVRILVVDVKKNRQHLVHVFDETLSGIIEALLLHRHERKNPVGEIDGTTKTL